MNSCALAIRRSQISARVASGFPYAMLRQTGAWNSTVSATTKLICSRSDSAGIADIRVVDLHTPVVGS